MIHKIRKLIDHWLAPAVHASRELEAAQDRIERLENQLRLKDDEIASLQVQLTAYRDTVEAMTWEQRLRGVIAKGSTESLRQPQR